MKREVKIKKIILSLFFIFKILFFTENVYSKEKKINFVISNIATVSFSGGTIKNSEEVRTEIIFEQKLSEVKIINEKEPSRDIVRIGETFKYKISINDVSKDRISYYMVEDFIPEGMEYIANKFEVTQGYSIEILKDDEKKDYLKITPDNQENISKDPKNINLSYLVRVGSSAKMGINYCEVKTTAYSDEYIYESNVDPAIVEILGEEFQLKGLIFGRVFIDSNMNGKFDLEDIGVPGAKIYLENGDYAISDSQGKYSIYGENAITHVVKIDMSSLPSGAELIPLGNFYNMKGDSVFAPLKTEQAYNANFALKKPSQEFLNKILERQRMMAEFPNEIINYLDNIELNFKKEDSQKKLLNSNGIVGLKKEIKFAQEHMGSLEEETDNFRKENRKIEEMDNSLGILDLDLGIVDLKQNLRVKAKTEEDIHLYINDEIISRRKIGKEITNTEKDLKIFEYIAVEFKKGKNKISLKKLDSFGNVREEKTLEVLAPDKFESFEIEVLSKKLESGQPINIKLNLYDKNNIQIKDKIQGTLISENGKFLTGDIDNNEEGVQFFTEIDGTQNFLYLPNEGTRLLEFEILIEGKRKKFNLNFERDKNPIFINGILEGRLNFNGLGKDELNRGNYIFENGLKNRLIEENYIFSNRGAVFLKGDISDDYHLTLSYDNNEEEDKFFGYKNPEDYYPIYGDNSIKGYEAQSTSKLYAKLESINSFFMYGDYETKEWLNKKNELLTYSRILNGGLFRYKNSNIEGITFVSKTSNVEIFEEIQGQGISGPYILNNKNIISGSEIVEIVTYSRNNPGDVLEITQLTRGIDYSIDYISGRILFSSPIPSTDFYFNPIFIKINYEVEEEKGREKRWIYGGELKYSPTPYLNFGSLWIKDNRDIEAFELKGAQGSLNLWNNNFSLEYAVTENFEKGRGQGYYLKHNYGKENFIIENKYLFTENNFENLSSSLPTGIESFEHNSKYTFDKIGDIKVEGKYLKDRETGNSEKELLIAKNFKISDTLKAQIGNRYYSNDYSDPAKEEDELITLGGKLIWNSLKFEKLSTFFEYEQDIIKKSEKRIGLGAKYRALENANFYINHEFLDNLGRDYAINPTDNSNKTLLGVETNYGFWGKHFTEYRVKKNEGIAELANGIKKDFKFGENLNISSTFERIEKMEKKSENTLSEPNSKHAFTIGYKYKINEKSYTNGDFELSLDKEKSQLAKFGYGSQLNESTYFVFRNKIYKEGDSASEYRHILGLAYRDNMNDRYNAFLKYEYFRDESILETGYKRDVNLLKLAQNYKYSERGNFTLSTSAKYLKDNYEGVKGKHISYLVVSGITHEITSKIDLGLNLGFLMDHTFRNTNYSLGIELGYQLPKNIWLSLGYNILGFSDKELDISGENKKGAYVRFRMKLDESLF